MKKGQRLLAERIRELYVDQRLSQGAIAKQLGVCQMTVSNYLRRNGVIGREVQRKSGVTAEQLREMYVTEGLTQEAIGKRLGISQGVVGTYLMSFGIETRNVGKPVHVILPEEELRRLYRDEGWTFQMLAAHFGCGRGTITDNITRYGLQMSAKEKKQHLRKRNAKRFTYTTNRNDYVLRKVFDHPYANQWGYLPEHRLVIEAALGRYLEPNEPVHHINLRPMDNQIENLALLPSSGDHMRVHHYMARVGAFLCGFTKIRPEPLEFTSPAFWAGKHVKMIDLVQEAQDANRLRVELPAGEADPLDKKNELIN